MSDLTLLDVRNLSVSYGPIPAVHDVSLRVGDGEIVVVVGPNGAGKSTLARTIFGRHHPDSGDILLEGTSLVGRSPHQIIRRGLSLVPEGRMLVSSLTTEDNLRLGGIAKSIQGADQEALDNIYTLFPRISERRSLEAGLLSGGEQQMVAIGRALVSSPKVLVLDEPSLGLAPVIVDTLFEKIRDLSSGGIGLLIVEQNARASLEIADTLALMRGGQIFAVGDPRQLADTDALTNLYVGSRVATDDTEFQTPHRGEAKGKESKHG